MRNKCTADIKICPLVYNTLQTFLSRIIYLIWAYFQNIITFLVLRATAFQKIPSAFCRDNQMFRTVSETCGPEDRNGLLFSIGVTWLYHGGILRYSSSETEKYSFTDMLSTNLDQLKGAEKRGSRATLWVQLHFPKRAMLKVALCVSFSFSWMSSPSLRCNCREIILGGKNLRANLGQQSPAATECLADYNDFPTAHSPHSSPLTINPTHHVINPSIQQTIYRTVGMLIVLLIYRCLYAH